jgi:integrase
MTQRRSRRGGVEDRWTKTNGDKTNRYGVGMRWRARYVDEQGREHAKGFRTKTEANRFLETIVHSQVEGTYVDPRSGQVTFGTFYADWLPRQVWVTNTRVNMDRAVASVTFGDVALAELRVSHVEHWVKTMVDRGLAPSTINTHFVNVRSVIKAAVRDRCLPRDVGDRVRLPRQRKAEAAMVIPTTDEVGALIRSADDWFASFAAVCAFAGLRRGEASALQVGDINFLGREIRVSRQVQGSAPANLEFRAPKYGSERTVYVSDGLLGMLAEHVRIHCPGSDSDRWLFGGRRGVGLPIFGSEVDRRWSAVRRAAGVSCRLHDMRHFYASGLIWSNCDVVTVQRAMGHASPAATWQTYAHLWPEASDRTRKASGELFDRSLKLLRTHCGPNDPPLTSELRI